MSKTHVGIEVLVASLSFQLYILLRLLLAWYHCQTNWIFPQSYTCYSWLL